MVEFKNKDVLRPQSMHDIILLDRMVMFFSSEANLANAEKSINEVSSFQTYSLPRILLPAENETQNFFRLDTKFPIYR